MLIEQVEALWSAIAERDDWGSLKAKVAAVRAMGRICAADGPADSAGNPAAP
jgi:serine/tyrosine/threonine adenylyltransferase